MYVILVYDVDRKRVGRMLKLCRKYLNWVQNSVFEGEISEVKLLELKHKASLLMDRNYDNVLIFKSRDQKWLEKEIVGVEKSPTEPFL